MVAGRARVALAHPLVAPPRLAASGDFFFLSVVLGDLVVGLGLDQPGLEDQGEPQAWEPGHGRSGRRGWAGKPPSQALYPVDCRPLAGTQGRVHSRAHILRCAAAVVLAEDGGLHCWSFGLAGLDVLVIFLSPRTDSENGFFVCFAGVFFAWVQSPTMGCRR
jgi:hypothetical protein